MCLHEGEGKQIAIHAKDLLFTYEAANYGRARSGAVRIPVVSQPELRLYKGESVGLTGPNGAGKTTLGKLLTGILKPLSGEVVLFGEEAGSLSLSQIGRKIGYAFQNPVRQLFAASVEEEIGFGLTYRGVSKEETKRIAEDMLELMQLTAFRSSFPLNLSFGEKKRVALAAILALSPEYLILDEPTTGLDAPRIEILNGVLAEMKSRGVGMLLISHNETFLEKNAGRRLTMEGGRIVHDRKIKNP